MHDSDRKTVSSYVGIRLNRGDDRCSEDKIWDDAKLRGSIGCKNANEVIQMIDDYKMRGS